MSGIFKIDLSEMQGPKAVVVMGSVWEGKGGVRCFPEPRTNDEIRLLAECLSGDEIKRLARERKRIATRIKRSVVFAEFLRSRSLPSPPPLGRRKRDRDPGSNLLFLLGTWSPHVWSGIREALSTGRKKHVEACVCSIAEVARHCGLKPSKAKIFDVLRTKFPIRTTTPHSLSVAIVATMDPRKPGTLRNLAAH